MTVVEACMIDYHQFPIPCLDDPYRNKYNILRMNARHKSRKIHPSSNCTHQHYTISHPPRARCSPINELASCTTLNGSMNHPSLKSTITTTELCKGKL